ncbi:MAG TPA: PaaI family thioesterase [Candidatus Avacidaminococcus intestinavium]|uniref:PaaI family thioesterase n=1 Tax=Candidatus Avacidaminococcus intestinavium TaxID=2840684 RepID=A0A9D1MPF2_9FIRM|nr:PaaI family thioesterase [Candidatus Avacidaminococcus intestinavium]
MTNWPEFIKNHFNNLPYFKFMNATVLDTSEGYAKVTLPIKEAYANTYGIAHGGVVTSLVDMVSGVALRTLKLRILTVEVTTDYLRPVKLDDILTAEAHLLQKGRHLLHADISIHNSEKRLVARGKVIYCVRGEDSIENYDLQTFKSII